MIDRAGAERLTRLSPPSQLRLCIFFSTNASPIPRLLLEQRLTANHASAVLRTLATTTILCLYCCRRSSAGKLRSHDMDPRQPQHPFPRQTDRPLIHNPNHQSAAPAQQPQAYSNYAPPVSQPQPPVHVPYSDPYTSSRRDPFLPTPPQQRRRGSYGLQSGDGVPAIQAERQVMNGGWGNTGTITVEVPWPQIWAI